MKKLTKIDRLNFIFTAPAFIEIDKNKRKKRQFEINAHIRERAVSGSEFEMNSKNELEGKPHRRLNSFRMGTGRWSVRLDNSVHYEIRLSS